MTASAADPKALSWRDHHRRLWLRDIADAKGDVDAYIALELEDPGGHVDVIEVAERLLAADRAEEALAWLDRPPACSPTTAPSSRTRPMCAACANGTGASTGSGAR